MVSQGPVELLERQTLACKLLPCRIAWEKPRLASVQSSLVVRFATSTNRQKDMRKSRESLESPLYNLLNRVFHQHFDQQAGILLLLYFLGVLNYDCPFFKAGTCCKILQ